MSLKVTGTWLTLEVHAKEILIENLDELMPSLRRQKEQIPFQKECFHVSMNEKNQALSLAPVLVVEEIQHIPLPVILSLGDRSECTSPPSLMVFFFKTTQLPQRKHTNALKCHLSENQTIHWHYKSTREIKAKENLLF